MKRFGRVMDGQIVEFPVYDYHIAARHQHESLYTPVVEGPEPEVPAFHSLRETPFLREGKIYLRYQITPVPVNDLLNQIHLSKLEPGTVVDPLNPEYPDVYLDEVDPVLAGRVLQLVKDHVQGLMDALAKTRDYDDAGSVVSRYFNSSVPRFKNDAVFMQGLLDTVWTTLYGFMGQMSTRSAPIPKSCEQITAMLPAMEWPAEDPV